MYSTLLVIASQQQCLRCGNYKQIIKTINSFETTEITNTITVFLT